MKLLFVIDNLSTGGAQRQMVNLAIGLTHRGHQVELFCYEPGDLLAKPLYDLSIQVHWHLKPRRYSPGTILALRRLINQGQYDLVLSFLTTANFYAVLGSRMLTVSPIPVIVSERRCDLPEGASLIERFSRQFYRLANHVVTNSHHRRADMAMKYPWLGNRISTIYNGYDLDALVPPVTQPDNHPLQILAIASVSPHKNGLCLIEALNLLRLRDGLSPQVDWIGELVMKGNRLEYLKEMKQSIEKYRLEKQWHWLNQRMDIASQLHKHDVLVHASYGEGLPNVVCEALACARPVIVSDTLDHPRLVQDGKSGYLFDYHDPSDLADKIKKFVELAPEDRLKMGRSGRQFAEQNLSLNRYVNEYERLFRTVTDLKGGNVS